jgi:hypothetical protein
MLDLGQLMLGIRHQSPAPALGCHGMFVMLVRLLPAHVGRPQLLAAVDRQGLHRR